MSLQTVIDGITVTPLTAEEIKDGMICWQPYTLPAWQAIQAGEEDNGFISKIVRWKCSLPEEQANSDLYFACSSAFYCWFLLPRALLITANGHQYCCGIQMLPDPLPDGEHFAFQVGLDP